MEYTAQISPEEFVVSYECEPPCVEFTALAMFTIQANDTFFWEVSSSMLECSERIRAWNFSPIVDSSNGQFLLQNCLLG